MNEQDDDLTIAWMAGAASHNDEVRGLKKRVDNLIDDYSKLVDSVMFACDGTGCATVEELRRKCDWAMDAIAKEIEMEDGECVYCTHCEVSNWTHAKDCSAKKNYYKARLK